MAMECVMTQGPLLDKTMMSDSIEPWPIEFWRLEKWWDSAVTSGIDTVKITLYGILQ